MERKVENEGMPVVRLGRELKYEGNILKMRIRSLPMAMRQSGISSTMTALPQCCLLQMTERY